MTYKVSFSFDKTLATDTPKSSTISKDPPFGIHVTATVTDANGATATGQILQFFTEPPTLIVMNDNDQPQSYDNDYGCYLLSDDGTGSYSFWLVAAQKTIVSTGFVVQDDPDSEVEGATVFFSSYVGLTTKYGPPDLPLDENGIIQLNSTNPYINVGLPLSTKPFEDYVTAQAALLVNGTQFVSEPFKKVFNEGFQVPTNMLDPTRLNRFGYTIVNGATSVSPVAPSVAVNGQVVTRPAPSILRTLNESPYLLNHAQVINDASSAVVVYIDFPTNNPDNIVPDDTIDITVYINGWLQGSNVPNNTIFTLETITVQQSDGGSPFSTPIPAGKLAGFGMNASGIPGSIYIDYTLTKAKETKVSAMPRQYFAGYINTVGPI